jgi:hypothetical protein
MEGHFVVSLFCRTLSESLPFDFMKPAFAFLGFSHH